MKMCISCGTFTCIVYHEQGVKTTEVRRLEWLALSAMKLLPNPPTYLDVYFYSMPNCLVPFEPTLDAIEENPGPIKMANRGAGDFYTDIKGNSYPESNLKRKQSKRRFLSLFQRKSKRSVKPINDLQLKSLDIEIKEQKPPLPKRKNKFLFCMSSEV